MDLSEFKQGMRRLAAGVSVVTTMDGRQPHGFSATSVTSVSADPAPLLLVCVNKSVTCHDILLRSGSFCVNVLSEAEIETARVFSSSEHRHRRFEFCPWEALATGAPALINALTNFDCRIHRAVEVQSHTVLFGEVVRVMIRGPVVHPLLYVDGKFDGLRSVLPAGAKHSGTA
ncbi:flavin reductase family protein [Dongia sedimenti]|uniref:Flavin reductase family protein n=1 Tax=Dongia sedimenti TaxID=3064282 RepID=A0ABU0YER7_9PROT|nr:flavin reductase family protein [Rhodospirillaceae bacterium R-7]